MLRYDCLVWSTKCVSQGLRGCGTGRYAFGQHAPVDPPDAAYAPSLRSQFASLQLGGHDLSLGFQLSGQSLKLQLLHGERNDRHKHSECTQSVHVNLKYYNHFVKFVWLLSGQQFLADPSLTVNARGHKCHGNIRLLVIPLNSSFFLWQNDCTPYIFNRTNSFMVFCTKHKLEMIHTGSKLCKHPTLYFKRIGITTAHYNGKVQGDLRKTIIDPQDHGTTQEWLMEPFINNCRFQVNSTMQSTLTVYSVRIQPEAW